MIRALKFPDANAMHERMCNRLMFGTEQNRDWDWTAGTEVGLHNIVIAVPSFAWEFDLKRLWMPPSRWTMMVRQYINPDAFGSWKAIIADQLAKPRGRGIAVLRTNMVQGRGVGRGVRRRWGSCMLAYSFRRNPVPTFTMHSRTTYFGYLAAMDITVANALAYEVTDLIGIHPAEMNFVWNLELAQFHGFRSLAWPLMNPDIREQMDADVDGRKAILPTQRPGYRKALDGYSRILTSDRAGKKYGDEAFSSFARVRRRFHTEAYGVEYGQQFAGGGVNNGGKGPFPPLPSTSTLDLNFACLDRPHATDLTDDEDYGFFPEDDENVD